MKKLGCIFICLLALSPIFGEEKDTEIIIFSRSEVHEGDYFAKGNIIEISGTIKGDAYLFGSQIYINGNIEGDLILAGGNVSISGNIGHNLRAAAGQFILTGTIGRNVTLFAGNVEFFHPSQIRGNLIAIGGNMDLDGTLLGTGYFFASNLRLSNKVGENLKIYATELRFTSKAEVLGNVEYWSNSDAYIDSDAQIKGEFVHHPSFFYTIKGKVFKGLRFGSKFIALMMNFIYSWLIGIVLLYFFYPKVERALKILSEKPLEAFIYGILVVVLLPLASLMLLMTIIGIPFALTLFGLNVIGFYTGKLFAILWVVKWQFKKIGYERHKKLYFSIGLLIYLLLTTIPIFGFVLSIAAMLFGLGAVLLGSIEKISKSA